MPVAEPVLVPIDFDSETDRADLLEQRKICGWCNTPAYIQTWSNERHNQPFWWIYRAGDTKTRVGHASIQFHDHERGEIELADRSRAIIMLSKVWIAKEARGGGFGNKVIDALEAICKNEYGAVRITLHAIAASVANPAYYAERGFPEMFDHDFSVIQWYLRRGYTIWKTVPRYHKVWPNGKTELQESTLMYKDVAPNTLGPPV